MRRKNYFTVEVDPTEKVPNWKWKPGSQGQLPAGSLELETPLTPPSLLFVIEGVFYLLREAC